MKTKKVLLILATALVVTGCSSVSINFDSDNSEKQEDVATVAATAENDSDEATADDTASTETSAETTVEGEAVSDAELEEFTKLFNFMDLNFGFLYPEYNSPEEIKWDEVIGYPNGLMEEKLSDEERKEIFGYVEEDPMEPWVVKNENLTKFIKKKTGLDVKVDAKDVPRWEYNEKYDVFLISDNPWGQDTPLAEGKFVSGTKNGNLYELTFHPGNESFDEESKQPDRVITFEKSGDDIVIKSNKILKK
ncbi:MAG: hypothetical protein IKQ00_04365 [Butyrivibrio sp.]|nr:hypothetical protein [Butyrivibrio sp.]